MTDQEIETSVLRRLYAGAFEPNVEYKLNLNEFAKELQIDAKHIWEIFGQLNEQNLVESYSLGGNINITSAGILYCEENSLVETSVIHHQRQIRTKLLDAAARLREKGGRWAYIHYTQLCAEAGVEEQDFHNNFRLLIYSGLLESKAIGYFQITPAGLEKVEEYRKRLARFDAFEKLKALEGITPQQRGHKLEDLLAEASISEGWDAESRVRSQGQEHDIIMHVGTHYFFISCKWEKESIESREVELLESRVRSRATTNGGLLFSMSGFTGNCIEEARMKISSAQILLFGPLDTESIFNGQTNLTELLNSKIEQAMHHRKIFVDGVAR